MSEKVTAIILAAGEGRRMKMRTRKQFLALEGKPVLYYTLDRFEQTSFINEIVLVTNADRITYCEDEIVRKYQFEKVKKIVAGGAQRFDSAYQGLQASADADYVFIHDGLRPFVNSDILERIMKAVRKCGACVAGIPAKDTIKIVDEKGMITETPRRTDVWQAQTPQAFAYPLIRMAYEQAVGEDIRNMTDDAMLVERQHHPVQMVEGSYDNFKITTQEDLLTARVLLQQSKPNVSVCGCKQIDEGELC